MGSRAKLYAVVGAGCVTGMFTVRELLQRGGNVRALMRDPDKYKAELEELIAYFPRGKRGVLECAACDVTKPETLTAGALRRWADAHSEFGCFARRAALRCAALRRSAACHAPARARSVLTRASVRPRVRLCAPHSARCAAQRLRACTPSSSAPAAPPGSARAAPTTSTTWRVRMRTRLRAALRCAALRAVRANAALAQSSAGFVHSQRWR
jgi:NAD(P)-dependent dehydrogenase (short-subunit alcohol dehydrogenase family)